MWLKPYINNKPYLKCVKKNSVININNSAKSYQYNQQQTKIRREKDLSR